MTPAQMNFNAKNATPWACDVPIYEADGTTPLDLSGYDSFLMHLKTDGFDPVEQVAPTVTLVIDAYHNSLHIAAPVADIFDLFGLYQYDIVGIIDDEPADVIMQGTINVAQGITVAGA